MTREERDPLGVLRLRTLVRKEASTDEAKDRNAKVRRETSESLRLAELVEEVGARCEGTVEAIHWMDGEADSFERFGMARWRLSLCNSAHVRLPADRKSTRLNSSHSSPSRMPSSA